MQTEITHWTYKNGELLEKRITNIVIMLMSFIGFGGMLFFSFNYQVQLIGQLCYLDILKLGVGYLQFQWYYT